MVHGAYVRKKESKEPKKDIFGLLQKFEFSTLPVFKTIPNLLIGILGY